MNSVWAITTGAKVVVTALFALILVGWLRRRSGGGDHAARSGITTPTLLAQVALSSLGLALAALMIDFATEDVRGAVLTTRAVLCVELALLSLWLVPLLVSASLRRQGARFSWERGLAAFKGSRPLVALGVCSQLAVFGVALAFRCAPSAPLLRNIGYRGGAGFLAAAALVATVYLVAKVHGTRKVEVPLSADLLEAWAALRSLFVKRGDGRWARPLSCVLALSPAAFLLSSLPLADTMCFVRQGSHGAYAQLGEYVFRKRICTNGAFSPRLIDWDPKVVGLVTVALVALAGASVASGRERRSPVAARLGASVRSAGAALVCGLCVMSSLLAYGTSDFAAAVRWQSNHAWGLFVQPLAFLVFMFAAAVDTERVSGALQRAGSPAGATHAVHDMPPFPLVERLTIVAWATLGTLAFLGGWSLPFIHREGVEFVFAGRTLTSQVLPQASLVLLGGLTLITKAAALCWLQLWVRSHLDRARRVAVAPLVSGRLAPAALANLGLTFVVATFVRANGGAITQALDILASLSMLAVAMAGIFALTRLALSAALGGVTPQRGWGEPSTAALDPARSSVGPAHADAG